MTRGPGRAPCCPRPGVPARTSPRLRAPGRACRDTPEEPAQPVQVHQPELFLERTFGMVRQGESGG